MRKGEEASDLESTQLTSYAGTAEEDEQGQEGHSESTQLTYYAGTDGKGEWTKEGGFGEHTTH
jgi:hypothetical protein